MKRLFCSLLASAVLLSACVTGVGATSAFKDADEITYIDAVNATTALGLFAGSDGKFLPKQNVTRAQMATIIVKMLKGSDFNANEYKGASNPFPDTADYQGGWAEGYINVCAQLGVVKGYGDGTFKPDNKVNAAEAVTMIINALKIDTGAGNWPDTYMAKAEELKLFGVIEPKPGPYDALVRDQLAVIVLQGVEQLKEEDAPTGGSTSGGSTSGGSTSGGSTSGGSTSGGSTSGGSTSGGSTSGGSTSGGNTSGGSTGKNDYELPMTPAAPGQNETPVVPDAGGEDEVVPPEEQPELTPGEPGVGSNETPWA